MSELEKVTNVPDELIYRQECYEIIGAVFEVYKDKGCGFVVGVYQECLEIELKTRGIPFISHLLLILTYRGQQLKQVYIPDIICYDKIIIELKSIAKLLPEHRAPIINYLKATNFELSLLVNFGYHPQVEYERIACTKGRFNYS